MASVDGRREKRRGMPRWAGGNRPGRHLVAASVSFRQVPHEPTPISADAARARGEPIGCGAKALLLKTGEKFRLFVLPADRKLDSALVKRQLGVDRPRFASKEEPVALTGLVPGRCHPCFLTGQQKTLACHGTREESAVLKQKSTSGRFATRASKRVSQRKVCEATKPLGRSR